MSEEETTAPAPETAPVDAAAQEALPEGFTPGLTKEQQLEAELAEAQDRYMRNLAETENFKKRVERERFEERAYSSQKVVGALLPVIDNLERALAAAKAQGGAEPAPALVQLEKGVELVLRQFEDMLKKEGVAAVPAEPGMEFDPNVHQALLQEPSDKYAEGAVLEVLQKGYKMGERLLRPALVKVVAAP